MKNGLLLSVLIGAMPLTMAAQDDDLYFTPKRGAKTEAPARFDRETRERPTYYCGSNRNVDEYNRRGKLKSYYRRLAPTRSATTSSSFARATALTAQPTSTPL